MKKKWTKMAVLLVLVCALLTVSVSAGIMSSEYLIRYSADKKMADGEIVVSFRVIASGAMSQLGCSVISFQRFNGSYWTVEHTSSYPAVSNLQTTNASSYSSNVSYTPLFPSATYRAVVTFYAEDAFGSESADLTVY